MKSSLHTEALCWLRFGRRLPVVCTEAGPWNADVLGLSSTTAIEVEVKRSKSDLMAEFRNKKAKHFLYANAETRPAPFVPNHFYFYVPAAMGEYTVKTVEELCPKAGVAVQLDTNLLDGRNTDIIRKATKLHGAAPSPRFLRTAVMRMSSELCSRHVAVDQSMAQVQAALEEIQRVAVKAAVRASGTLDCEDPKADLAVRAAELAFAVEQVNFLDLPDDDQKQKWIDAAQRHLEAQYLTDKEQEHAPYRF